MLLLLYSISSCLTKQLSSKPNGEKILCSGKKQVNKMQAQLNAVHKSCKKKLNNWKNKKKSSALFVYVMFIYVCVVSVVSVLRQCCCVPVIFSCGSV